MNNDTPLLLPGASSPGASADAPRTGVGFNLHPSTVRRIVGIAVIVAIGLAWIVVLRPLGLRGPASYIVVSGRSMEPTYRTGDLVITRSASVYDVGDVVAFRIPADGSGRRPVVIHRIVGGDATGYVLRGDNKSEPDLWRPRPDDILGRAWIALPRLGYVLAAARSPLAIAALAAVFVFLATQTTSSEERRRTRSR